MDRNRKKKYQPQQKNKQRASQSPTNLPASSRNQQASGEAKNSPGSVENRKVLTWLGWVVFLVFAVTLLMIYQYKKTPDNSQPTDKKETFFDEQETRNNENSRYQNYRIIESTKKFHQFIKDNNFEPSPSISDEPE